MRRSRSGQSRSSALGSKHVVSPWSIGRSGRGSLQADKERKKRKKEEDRTGKVRTPELIVPSFALWFSIEQFI